MLITSSPGYALRLGTGQVDAWEFERLVSSAMAGLDADPRDALGALDRALALWRGAAYAEFADAHWARADGLRLEELRLQAVEHRADAGLRLGQVPEVITAMSPHVLEHPLRERGWALLAAGQYAAGRQAEALATLRRARVALADSAGLDPGRALRVLEADILAQAERLVTLPPPRAQSSPAADVDWFVGRQVEMDRLLSIAERGGVVQLTGEAGAGKTALLDRLAGLLTERGWLVGYGRCAETGGVLPGYGHHGRASASPSAGCCATTARPTPIPSSGSTAPAGPCGNTWRSCRTDNRSCSPWTTCIAPTRRP
jgi:hypothetical protein